MVKSILLFIVAIILMQIFYVVMTKWDLFSDAGYFPYGYIVQIAYYSSLFIATLLFVGKLDFGVIGFKLGRSWRLFLLIGLVFALVNLGVKIVVLPGSFTLSYFFHSYNVPLILYIADYVLLGILIGLAEESAFRGYILGNFLKRYSPIVAVLASSVLFGVYHVNILDLNYYSLPFWSVYVVQALTGGIFMALLFFKTGGNIIGPIAYHSGQIIVGQLIPWTPSVTPLYLLGISTIINIAQTIVLFFLPINKRLPENATPQLSS